jgi:hypothetical protein
MNWSERLENLLRSCDFEKLKPEDRQWVSKQMTGEEYDLARKMILFEKNFSEEPHQVDSRQWTAIEARFDKIYASAASPSLWSRTLNRKIALWKAAAVILLVGILGYWKETPPSAGEREGSQTVVYVRDTVFLDSAVARVAPPKTEAKSIRKPAPSIAPKQPDQAEDLVPNQELVSLPGSLSSPEMMPITITEPVIAKGQNVREVSALMKMLVEVY